MNYTEALEIYSRVRNIDDLPEEARQALEPGYVEIPRHTRDGSGYCGCEPYRGYRHWTPDSSYVVFQPNALCDHETTALAETLQEFMERYPDIRDSIRRIHVEDARGNEYAMWWEQKQEQEVSDRG